MMVDIPKVAIYFQFTCPNASAAKKKILLMLSKPTMQSKTWKNQINPDDFLWFYSPKEIDSENKVL